MRSRVWWCVVVVLMMSATVTCVASGSSPGVVGWGGNLEGGLGDGETEDSDSPVAVSGLSEVDAVAASGGHTMALLSDGTVMTWGTNEYGEIGNGLDDGPDQCGWGWSPCSTTPVAVEGLSGVSAIAAGSGYDLARLSNGTVMSWGENFFGELGDGTSTGPETECGQYEGGICSKTPTKVGELTKVASVAAGGRHSLALLENGTVVAWGENQYGQLGDETTEGPELCSEATPTPCSTSPVAVTGLSEVSAVAAGFDHSLALLKNGTVKAWGSNECGDLGDGTTATRTTPVEVSGLTKVIAISAGVADSLALLENGTVESWGCNTVGQIGDGTTTVRHTPVEVSGLTKVTAVSAGAYFSRAMLEDGTVMSWGFNGSGELGDGLGYSESGACVCSKIPVEAVGLSNVSDISAGGGSDSFAFGPNLAILPLPTLEEKFGLTNPGEPNLKRSCAGKPVDCATGNEVESQKDISVGGRGIPLTFERTYNAQAAVAESSPGPFGYGWSASFSDHLNIEPGAHRVTVVQSNGSTVVFNGSTEEPGELTVPEWAQARLVLHSGGSYTYTLPDQRTFDFDSEGHLVSEADRNGNTTTMHRGLEGRLESVADPSGRELTFSYNEKGEIEAIKDPMGHTVKYAYEGNILVGVIEPGESTPRWQFKYDGSHRLISIIDGRGGVTTNKYDESNRVISQTDPMEHTLTFEYGVDDTLITNKSTGSMTKEIFDVGGEPSVITHAYGTIYASTEVFTYDRAGNLVRATDGRGYTTKFGYDAAGDQTSMADPDGDKTTWTYDSSHDVLTVTTPNEEATTTIERDSHGNPIKVSRPAPGGETQTIENEYDAHGDLVFVKDALDHVWKYEYDSAGDRTSETEPEGNTRTWEYNNDSQEIGTVSPRGNVEGAEPAKYTTTIERDAQNRTKTITDPLGHNTKYAYDENGNVEAITDANGHTTKYTYNADNEQTKIKTATGAVTEAFYDGAGQVISQTDGNKHTTKYSRNALERVITVSDPLERKTTKKYDKAGNLISLTDPEERTTTYTYDAADRLKKIGYSDGKTHSVEFSYDADGDRTRMVDGSGTTYYTYDELDRLVEGEDGHEDLTRYKYNLDNQPISIMYPNHKTVKWEYNEDGELHKVTDWLEHTTTFSYDPDSDLSTVTYPTATNEKDTYTYNEADQMSEIAMKQNSETLVSLAYLLDKIGQITKTASKGLPGEETIDYHYDETNRVTEAGADAYEYDAANNPTMTPGSSSSAYDEADQLEHGTGVAYSYNESGERTSGAPTGGGPATSYEYDQGGNLVSIERPGEGEVASIEDGYTYNGDDLRVSQTVAGKTHYITWNTNENLPSILDDGERSYIYGPDDTPIEQINDSTGAVMYLHHDEAGSTRLLTGSTGTVEGAYSYDAYGNLVGYSGTATTPLGYDGQYTSDDTGLIYMRARVYDPATVQFLSVDPIEAITRAPYNYATDNPLNYSDPSGLSVLGTLESAGEAVLHVGLDVAAVPPYAVYYGSYMLAHGINSLGEEFGLPGEVVSHLAALPLTELEALGLSGDALIDLIKGQTVNNESICDEGEVGYINPLHGYVPEALNGPEAYLPGIHENGEIDFEW